MLEVDDKIAAMAPDLSPTRRSPSTPSSTIVPSRRSTPDGRRPGPRLWLADVAEAGRGRHRPRSVADRRVSGWRPEYVLPAAATVFKRLGELIADGTVFDALASPASGRSSATRCARHRRRHRRARGVVEDRPLGGRLADHRAADDAVDRLVPAGHPAVQAVRGGDHVRRRARRRAVDRQRADHRRRPRAAAARAGRQMMGAGRWRDSATSCCRRRCRRSSAA